MSDLAGHGAPDPEAGTVRGIWRKLIRIPLYAFIWLVLRVRVEGMDNIPPEGNGVFVVSNHLHNADPVLLEIVFPRPLHFMAKEEIYRIKPLGWLVSKFGNFPVVRGKSDRRAVRSAIARLQHGVAVGLFPEGTRSRTMRLGPARAGAGFIANQANVPILPVAITGSERLPLNGKRPPAVRPVADHPGIFIRIGEPFTLPKTGNDGRRLSPEQAADRMMWAIAELLPEDYRGVYPSSESSTEREASASASSAARTN
ncbi:MAG TPA: lysophospholipid acyltransferase family protein [Thermomicrobiales bacterium]|nr:lysophospholipid acyltransferase family protein [Thermomicrobiales bacterium]